MGTWGMGLYSDDEACDVRDRYRELVGQGETGSQATRVLLDEWKDQLTDADVAPAFWLALADTQWKCGRLEPEVKNEALKLLEGGAELERCKRLGASASDLKKRGVVLDRLSEQLRQPPPAPKRVRPPTKFVDFTAWEPGEVIGYELSEGLWVLLHVVSLREYGGAIHPVCALLDWQGPRLPPVNRIKELRPRMMVTADPREVKALEEAHGPSAVAVHTHFIVTRLSEKVPLARKIQRLNVKLKTPNAPEQFGLVFGWNRLQTDLAKYFGVS